MPVVLASRCRSAVAAVAQQKRSPWRRLTLIGGIVALAAAAAWVWSSGHSLPPAPAPIATATVASGTPAGAASSEASQIPGRDASPLPERAEIEELTPTAAKLPVVLPPGPRLQVPRKLALALQKAVERHPELVQGPRLDDEATFAVAVALRTDGSVVGSAAELASNATFTAIADQVQQLLPETGESLSSSFGKGHQTSGGELRARVLLLAALIPEGFDLARSSVRVREILGRRYHDQMLPFDSEEVSHLTVFLSDDGRVLREKMERVTLQNAAVVMGTGSGARPEEVIALKLGIGIAQIGAVGSTVLEDGALNVVVAPDGTRRLEGKRAMVVRYAWAKRPDEPPSVEMPLRAVEQVEDFDVAAALVVVERVLPDAFSHTPPTWADMMTRPTVVFTSRGEVLRAGRVQVRNGVDTDSLLQEQLVPGVTTHLHRAIRLTNKAGATALVELAWAVD